MQHATKTNAKVCSGRAELFLVSSASVWPPPGEFAEQRSRARGIRSQSQRNLANADVSKFPHKSLLSRFTNLAEFDSIRYV